MDLKRFLRPYKAEFDAIRFRLEGNCLTHLRPIQGMERLAVFLNSLPSDRLARTSGGQTSAVESDQRRQSKLGKKQADWLSIDNIFFETCEDVRFGGWGHS
uniref:Uncharacterized protein n=1 Tax=Ditylenchus dipsaci TaxID=166011 RepID=A0A915EE38_9BILA